MASLLRLDMWHKRVAIGVLLCVTGLSAFGAHGENPPSELTGFRHEDYRAPVPASLAGATTLTTDAAHQLWQANEAVFIDVLPYTPKPENLPKGTLWREKPRDNIPTSLWLPNVGYGSLHSSIEAWFQSELERLSAGDKNKTLVFYCLDDCWMSWNAAKRALSYGYSRIYWYPEGTDGWALADYPLERAQPRLPDPQVAVPPMTDQPDTSAQALLFDTLYFADLTPPVTIGYTYEQENNRPDLFGPNRADPVNIRLTPPQNKAKKNTAFYDLHNGKHVRKLGPFSDVLGNPITILFLERDVHTMSRHAGVSEGALRSVVRRTLGRAYAQQTRFETAKGSVAGFRITIKPFDAPDLPEKLAPYRHKVYDFLISDAVPGGVYRIESNVPGDESGTPQFRQRVTFDTFVPRAVEPPATNKE